MSISGKVSNVITFYLNLLIKIGKGLSELKVNLSVKFDIATYNFGMWVRLLNLAELQFSKFVKMWTRT